MKKLVLKLDLHDDREKKKAMMAVSGLSGVDSISMDMKERKLTVIGHIDPVTVVSKLRKNWPSTEIVSVGPAKEPGKKKEDGKKDDGKKEDGKKDDGKKEDGKKDDGKKEDGKKDDGKKKDPNEQYREFMKTYGPRAPANMPYYVHSDEENPNACVIS